MLLPLLSLSSGQSQKIVFNGLRVTKTFCTRDAEEGIFFYILWACINHNFICCIGFLSTLSTRSQRNQPLTCCLRNRCSQDLGNPFVECLWRKSYIFYKPYKTEAYCCAKNELLFGFLSTILPRYWATLYSFLNFLEYSFQRNLFNNC